MVTGGSLPTMKGSILELRKQRKYLKEYNKGNWDQSIRNAFEDAIDKCGLEARSGRLWEAFIDWEKSHGNLDYVLGIYDRLLVIPVIPCEVHFEK
jgi:hypothetical protein